MIACQSTNAVYDPGDERARSENCDYFKIFQKKPALTFDKKTMNQ